jgi:hypothetical protein
MNRFLYIAGPSFRYGSLSKIGPKPLEIVKFKKDAK